MPPETMTGALCAYVSNPTVADFQPMGSNMGILPPLEERERSKEKRYEKMAGRALEALAAWQKEQMEH